MAASIQVPTTFKAIDKFSSVVSKMTSGLKTFSKQGGSAIKRVDNKLNSSIKSIGKVGLLLGGLTLGSLFNEAVQGNLKFNDSLASVSAITGATGKDLADLEQRAITTAKETKKLGSDVLKAYELVGSAKPELLSNTAALDGVTRSVILLSKASRMDLEGSTKSLTDVLNQFNLAGKDSAKTVDILAAGAKFGAAAIPQISESIVQFGTVAKQSNVSLLESVAAVEVFAAKGVKGAEAGTKMRNVLTTLATAKALPKKALGELSKFGVDLDIVSDKTLPLSERLKEMGKISGDATAMVKVFGKENQGAGAILLNNIPLLDQLTNSINENGVANTQAAANTGTLKFLIDSIKTSFINATTATNSNNSSLKLLKDILSFVSDNMEGILGTAGLLAGAFLLWKGVVIGLNAVTWLQSIALGAQAAANGVLTKSVVKNEIAMKAYKSMQVLSSAATWVATTATTAFGVALNLGLWPILAIIAAIAAVIAIFYYWDDITAWFGRQWETFTAFIGIAWEKIVSFFKEFDFIGFFKDIGISILDFMLTPLKTVLTVLAKIPGKIGNLASGALANINATLDTNGSGNESGGVLPSTTQAGNTASITNTTQNNLSIDIRDKGNNVSNVQQSGSVDMPVRISNTVGEGI